jgi:glycosyltransferase involved in cell wall biosynthesis
MHILIVNRGLIPVHKYGGTERVIWYLGRELVRMGHKVTYLVQEGSHCDFARVRILNPDMPVDTQVPDDIDLVHVNFPLRETLDKPYLVTIHGNSNDFTPFDLNTVFVSRNHAQRYGSQSFVHNGLDWDDYGKPDLGRRRHYFHFLGNAAWRVKNIKGAISVIAATKNEKLHVLGGTRINFRMGFRITLSARVRFHGMIGGQEKHSLLNGSKGLIFPVRWHEPFGLAITESMYFGCPVFGTPYGSLPELVIPEVGFLSTDHLELARQAEQSEQFDPYRCHEYAVDLFNARKMALNYLEKYEQLLDGKTLNQSPPKLVVQQQEKFLPWT